MCFLNKFSLKLYTLLYKYLYIGFSYIEVYLINIIKIKMARKPLTISIEKEVLKKFKQYCEDEAINLSRKIEKYMKEELKKKKK